MVEPEHERLIRALSSDLRPIQPLRAPWLRALGWCGASAAVAVLLVLLGLAWHRAPGEMSEQLAFVAVVATAVCSALAALSLAVPGRSHLWGLLPLPPLLAWMGTSGWGCWQTVTEGASSDAPAPMACFRFIVAVSLPLVVVMLFLLRRSFCAHVTLTATLAGLASATAAAALLEVYHSHAMPLADMAAHFGAVLLVVGASRLALPAALRWWLVIVLALLPLAASPIPF